MTAKGIWNVVVSSPKVIYQIAMQEEEGEEERGVLLGCGWGGGGV